MSYSFLTSHLGDYIYTCKCGQCTKHRNYWSMKCSSCGDREYLDYTGRNEEKVYYKSVLRSIEKSVSHFKIEKINTSVRFDKESRQLWVKENSKSELLFDLKTDTIEGYKDGKVIETNSIRTMIQTFFRNVDKNDFLEVATVEENKELFKGFVNYYYYNQKTMQSYAYDVLSKLMNNKQIQILANCGFTDIRQMIRNSSYLQNETKPHKILGVPKGIIQYIKDADGNFFYYINRLQNFMRDANGNDVKLLFQIAKEEISVTSMLGQAETISQLYFDYGYTDVKKLALYLFRETRFSQGIDNVYDSCRLLRDYVRMSTEMNLDYEKYPQSLKKSHDIAVMNYNLIKDKIENEKFVRVIEEEGYKDLEFKTKEYSIVAPKEAQDLVKEGKTLSHCLSSYRKDVIAKKCKIYFMRLTDSLEESLISIEVRDGNKIRQCKGKSNRKPNKVESDFIEKWATKKKLEVVNY